MDNNNVTLCMCGIFIFVIVINVFSYFSKNHEMKPDVIAAPDSVEQFKLDCVSSGGVFNKGYYAENSFTVCSYYGKTEK